MAQDPYKYFRIEAREILDGLGAGALALEKGDAGPEVAARLLRLAHTLKGAARVVKQKEIADLAHAAEDALAPLRDGGVAPSSSIVNELLRIVDAMAARLGALDPAAPAEKSAGAKPKPEEPIGALRADAEDLDTVLQGVAALSVEIAGVRRAAGALDRAEALAALLVDQIESLTRAAASAPLVKKARSIAEELGALVAACDRELATGLEQSDRELAQLRESAERLRLVPASSMFGVLERTARDTAVSLGKRAALVTKGGDVRLDAALLGVVQGALVQAVKNAVVHGIEVETERTARGKPPEGRIAIEVARRGGRVSFICRDDGRGVDLDAVGRAAARRGTPRPGGEGRDELLKTLLAGGISTSRTVTELAGRGVGLDVVREAASKLRGVVALETEANRGTSLEITVPASLSSLAALVVEAGGQTAAIPLDCVRSTVRLGPSDVARGAEGDSVVVEGNVIPFAPLARTFRAGPVAARHTRGLGSAVIVESDGALAAVGVDRLVGTETVVLQPLPDLTPPAPVVAGASLDREGHPRPVLDPAGLLAATRRARAEREAPAAPRAPILVIDDSLTTRMLEQSILESAGYEVDVATSGEAGLEKARARAYGLFLVDVEMPGMDGFTFVQTTRADPDLSRVPAILVTSRAAPEDRARGAAAGAAAYVVKGEFDQNELLDRIKKLVVSR